MSKKKKTLININEYFAHTVQRLGCVPPGPLEHSQLYYELLSVRALPRIVHQRKVLDASPRCSASRYGLLHRTRGDRGRHLR